MNVTLLRRSLRTLAALVTCAAMAVACGGGSDGSVAKTKPAAQKKHPAATPAPVDPDEGLANAVIVGKTAAPITLKYNLTSKPQVGQPFEVELTLLTRQPADALDVAITGMTGLSVVNGGSAHFEPVEAGGRYTTKVLAQADASGLYYIGIVAKVQTKVQTESRTFSVPLAVGNVTAAAKPAPATDAAGEPVKSMPANEKTEPTTKP